MKKKTLLSTVLVGMMVFMAVCLMVPFAMAQDEGDEHVEAAGEAAMPPLGVLGLGIGAGLAVGLAGIGTGLAQSGVGAGGTGALAEKPELLVNVLILFAIPETIVILGFVIAFFLFNSI